MELSIHKELDVSLTIGLSGPQAQRKSVAAALKDAGFRVVQDEFGDPIRHDHGMEHEVMNGAWVTVEGSDMNAAHTVVEPFGWRLRTHHETDEPERPPTSAERLARFGLTADDLREILKGN